MTQVQVDKTTRKIVAIGEFPAGSLDPNIEIVTLTPEQEATMQQPGSKTLTPEGIIVVTAAAEPAPIFFERGGGRVSKLRTTNATATEIWRMTTQNNTGYKLRVEIIAVDAGNGLVATDEVVYTFKNIGGTITLVGLASRPSNMPQADAGVTWSVAPFISGQDVGIRVTGAAGRNIDWNFQASMIRFTPGGFPNPGGLPD